MNYLANFINYLQATKNLSSKTLAAYKAGKKPIYRCGYDGRKIRGYKRRFGY